MFSLRVERSTKLCTSNQSTLPNHVEDRMNFIRRLIGNDGTDGKEEPLFQPVTGGEEIQFDEEEQAAIDAALREDDRRDEEFRETLREAGIEPDGQAYQKAKQLQDQGQHVFARRNGLKKLAYERYTNNQYALAAQTCVKALGVSGDSTGMYRHTGVAEAWLLLAHMHACTGRFNIAKGLIKNAQQAAKKDDLLIGDMRDMWKNGARSLESDVRAKRRPAPVTTILKWTQ